MATVLAPSAIQRNRRISPRDRCRGQVRHVLGALPSVKEMQRWIGQAGKIPLDETRSPLASVGATPSRSATTAAGAGTAANHDTATAVAASSSAELASASTKDAVAGSATDGDNRSLIAAAAATGSYATRTCREAVTASASAATRGRIYRASRSFVPGAGGVRAVPRKGATPAVERTRQRSNPDSQPVLSLEDELSERHPLAYRLLRWLLSA